MGNDAKCLIMLITIFNIKFINICVHSKPDELPDIITIGNVELTSSKLVQFYGRHQFSFVIYLTKINRQIG